MIRWLHIQIAVFLTPGFLISFFSFGAEGELEDRMFVEIAEAQKPLKAFYNKYEAALDRLEKTAQSEGNLEGIIEIQAEKKAFSKRDLLPEKQVTYSKLLALQKVFHAEKDQQMAAISKKERAARLKYAAGLDELVKKLTIENKIDEAVAMKTKAEAARQNAGIKVAQNLPTTNADVIFDSKTSDFTEEKKVTTRKEGDLLVLQGVRFGSYIRSEKEFTVPFKIRARAMTDSSNVRFFFHEYPIVVFNWEGNHSEMRLRNPATRKPFGKKGAGELRSNQMYEFEIEITPEKVRISADGKLRFEYEGEFADLKGPVGIGPAAGSTVTVEYFAAEELPTN